MKENWQHRDYRPGDEYLIMDLFRKAFGGREMSLETWRWYFQENPFGHGLIKLLFDGELLIGHYAVIPMNLTIVSGEIKAVLSMTTMTHPDYGGQGIFPFLAGRTYEKAIQDGFVAVFGFPNKNSYHSFIKKLDWCDLGKMKDLRITPTSFGNIPHNLRVGPIDCFDSRADELWRDVKIHYGVTVPRTSRFLNWRFCQNPNVTYYKLGYFGPDGRMLGYAVLKDYIQKDNSRHGHIVDLISIPHSEVVEVLIRESLSYFSNTAASVSCWFPESSYSAVVLRGLGAIIEETDTNFGIRIFDDVSGIACVTGDMINWHLTMANSDVF